VSKNKPWWKRLDEDLEGEDEEENPYPNRNPNHQGPVPYPFPDSYKMPPSKDRYPDGRL
jgi:hypothetical protein